MQKIKREVATFRDVIYQRLRYSAGSEKDIVDQFHKLYYDSYILKKAWGNTSWMGVSVGKCPFDLWIYQELIFQVKPDLIIETGTSLGGSAYYYASLLDFLGNGRVVTIDIDEVEATLSKVRNAEVVVRPKHDRVTYLLGSSTSEEIVRQVKIMAGSAKKVLVTLDSDHSKEHVLNELRTYAPLVSKDSYLIVEDSNINGHPVYPTFGPGPMEALEEFMKENESFVVDRSNEKHLMTFNPKGLLKKIK